MTTDLSLKQMKKEWHGTYKAYAIGFSASLLLTCLSFFLTYNKWITGNAFLITIVALALVQAVFQLLFFLHLGQEARPRWESLIFFCMVLILLTIVLGTLWVMYDLNSRMMQEHGGVP